jgi:predicted cupin superfamily sugar epimerase
LIDLRDTALPAERIIRALDLHPHPEGGHYREVWRDGPAVGRGVGTAILFLLQAEEVSHWHRVDAAEIWLWQAGGPLVLTTSPDGHDAATVWLGPDLAARQVLQSSVPPRVWQTAASLGAWTLVSCVVCPAFSFDGFELAPADWRPTPRS